jgi:hypothetical protein
VNQKITMKYPEEIQYTVPARTTVVHKRIWNPDQKIFEPVTFVRVLHSRYELDSVIKYHTEHHGKPQLQGKWWHDRNGIWLREELATFWLLKTSS